MQQNIAYQSNVTASSQLPDEPASRAVDGSEKHYCPDSHPPHWLQTNFDDPRTIDRVAGGIASWPSGQRHVQIWATLLDNTQVLLAEYDQRMHDQQVLAHDLPGALDNVVAVRFLTLEGEVWPCWYEIEVLTAAPETPLACLVKPAATRVNLRSGASTATDIIASLSAGQAAIAMAQTQGNDGFTWWQLTNRTWIRDDVATTSPGCEAVEDN